MYPKQCHGFVTLISKHKFRPWPQIHWCGMWKTDRTSHHAMGKWVHFQFLPMYYQTSRGLLENSVSVSTVSKKVTRLSANPRFAPIRALRAQIKTCTLAECPCCVFWSKAPDIMLARPYSGRRGRRPRSPSMWNKLRKKSSFKVVHCTKLYCQHWMFWP